MTNDIDKKKQEDLQDSIARKIIIQGSLCALIPCALSMGLCLCAFHLLAVGQIQHPTAWMIGLLTVQIVFSVIIFVCLFFIARDVARQSIRPLQESLARERQFTSYASHELRTPLAVIKGSLEVLVRKPRTQEEYERKIKENIGVVDNMNRMVDNMLMLTRADSPHFRLTPTDINIHELFSETISAYSNQIIRRGLHITMNVAPNELTINADRNALGIIVGNLISNATKYCDDGGEIKLSAYRQDGHTLMAFSNTGRGIPTAECEKVFDKFYRSISTGHQQVKGFGLGLAVVRRFASLIGADVHFDSCPEGPTTVSIVFKD
jgi:signal transduction histidine kinase